MPTLNQIPTAGLLEQTTLVLRPSADDRHLFLASAGAVVGFARRRRGHWLRPWQRLIVEVHEQEEAPLVCTIRRMFTLWPRYEVRDAEDELVGVLAGQWILDRWQRGTLRVQSLPDGGQLLDDQNAIAARWTVAAGDVSLELLPPVQNDPFAKMLVLAAVLLR